MYDNIVYSIIPLILIALLAVFMRQYCRSWLEPGALFPLIVFIVFAIPLMIAPSFTYYSGAFWWLIIATISFCCGCILILAVTRRRQNSLQPLYENKETEAVGHEQIGLKLPGIRILLLISIVLGIASSVIIIFLFGRTVRYLFSYGEITDLGTEISALRYTTGFAKPLLSQILLTFVYISPILGGAVFELGDFRYHRLSSIVSFAPAILMLLINTTRAPVILAIVLWASSYFSFMVYSRSLKDLKLFSKKVVIVVVVLLLIVALSFAMGDAIRGHTQPNLATIYGGLTSKRAKSAILGHSAAFSIWFNEAWSEEAKITYGAYTFAGPFNISGLRERKQAIFSEFSRIGDGCSTNVYTAFRGLIEDFSYSGSIVFLFILGLLSMVAFHKVYDGRIVFIPILIAFYAFLMYQITSIFNYNSVILALVAVQIYFIIIRKQGRNISVISSKVQS